jgi:hypothetical protein
VVAKPAPPKAIVKKDESNLDEDVGDMPIKTAKVSFPTKA